MTKNIEAWQRSGSSSRRIVLLRHAEKTGLPGDRDLSQEGMFRAEALSGLPEIVGPIDAIIAAQSVEKSARPVQTMQPLARRLGLLIDERWNTGDELNLATLIAKGSAYEGKQIVISWRHKELTALAHAFGASSAPPWPKTLYERVWLITFCQDTIELAAFRQVLEAGGLVALVDE
ncbi:MAG: hypothetical protein WDM89_21995 [Rhizomicrobium sp.]